MTCQFRGCSSASLLVSFSHALHPWDGFTWTGSYCLVHSTTVFTQEAFARGPIYARPFGAYEAMVG